MSLLSPFFTCNNKRLDFIISFKYEIKACDLIHNKILQKKAFRVQLLSYLKKKKQTF